MTASVANKTSHAALAEGRGVLFAILAAGGFAAKAIFVKIGYRYAVGAETLLMLRMLFAMPFFVWMLWPVQPDVWRGKTLGDWSRLIMLGLLGYYLSSYLDFVGLQYISASLERLTLFLYPTLVLFISCLFLGKRYSSKVWWGVAVAYLGMVVTFSQDVATAGQSVRLWQGMAWVVASTVTYAIYLVGSGEVIAYWGATRFAALASLVSCLAVFVHFAVVSSAGLFGLPWPVYGIGLAMGLISTVIPVWCLNQSIRCLGAGRASSVAIIGPVITMGLGWLILGENLTPLQLVGAGLVIAGIVLVGRSK